MKTCTDCGFDWLPDLESLKSDDCPRCKWKENMDLLDQSEWEGGMELVIQNNIQLQAQINQIRRNNEAAMDILQTYGNIEGSDHRMWVIDQTLRALMGDDKYKNFREELSEVGYSWEEGIAP